MNFKKTQIPDVIIIEPLIHSDDRGYFTETYREDKLEEFLGHKINFCQDQESISHKNVLRGLHFQIPPFEQTKLVRVTHGAVLDIAVDIRVGSPTFGKYVKQVLSQENKLQMFIPKGFAHGFISLQNNTLFSYKVDNIYSAEHDRGLIFSDENINISLDVDFQKILMSDKDKKLPTLIDIPQYFNYVKK